MYGLAVDEILAAVRLVRPGHDLDQGGFSRAVLAAERVHLAGVKGKADLGKSFDAGKDLGDVSQLDQRHSVFRHSLTSCF